MNYLMSFTLIVVVIQLLFILYYTNTQKSKTEKDRLQTKEKFEANAFQQREQNLLKENILFAKFLAADMTVPLSILTGIFRENKSLFKDHITRDLIKKQIYKLTNIHQNISKIDDINYAYEKNNPKIIFSFKKMYLDLVLQYKDLFSNNEIAFYHNYYSSHNYGITKYHKEIELIIKNIFDYTLLQSNIIEKTYFSVRLNNDLLTIKISTIDRKTVYNDDVKAINKTNSDYNKIDVIAKKINGRIEIKKESNHSKRITFRKSIRIHNEQIYDESLDYIPKIVHKPTSKQKHTVLIINDNYDKYKYLKMGLKNTCNLQRLNYFEKFIKNVSINSPKTIIIDFSSQINTKIKLLNALKNETLTKNIPVLGLIAEDDLQSESIVLNEGIDMILKKPFRINQMENYLMNLIKKTEMASTKNSDKKETRISNTLIDLLNKTIEEQIKSGDLSNTMITQKMEMNYKSLNLKIKILTGKTLAAYVLDFRLEKAEKLLKGDLLIKEICYDCGFDDTANFNRAFKRKYEKSPAKYRAELDQAS